MGVLVVSRLHQLVEQGRTGRDEYLCRVQGHLRFHEGLQVRFLQTLLLRADGKEFQRVVAVFRLVFLRKGAQGKDGVRRRDGIEFPLRQRFYQRQNIGLDIEFTLREMRCDQVDVLGVHGQVGLEVGVARSVGGVESTDQSRGRVFLLQQLVRSRHIGRRDVLLPFAALFLQRVVQIHEVIGGHFRIADQQVDRQRPAPRPFDGRRLRPGDAAQEIHAPVVKALRRTIDRGDAFELGQELHRVQRSERVSRVRRRPQSEPAVAELPCLQHGDHRPDTGIQTAAVELGGAGERHPGKGLRNDLFGASVGIGRQEIGQPGRQDERRVGCGDGFGCQRAVERPVGVDGDVPLPVPRRHRRGIVLGGTDAQRGAALLEMAAAARREGDGALPQGIGRLDAERHLVLIPFGDRFGRARFRKQLQVVADADRDLDRDVLAASLDGVAHAHRHVEHVAGGRHRQDIGRKHERPAHGRLRRGGAHRLFADRHRHHFQGAAERIRDDEIEFARIGAGLHDARPVDRGFVQGPLERVQVGSQRALGRVHGAAADTGMLDIAAEFRQDQVQHLEGLDVQRPLFQEMPDGIGQRIVRDLQDPLVDRENDDLRFAVRSVRNRHLFAGLHPLRGFEINGDPPLFAVDGKGHDRVGERGRENLPRTDGTDERHVDVGVSFHVPGKRDLLNRTLRLRLEPAVGVDPVAFDRDEAGPDVGRDDIHLDRPAGHVGALVQFDGQLRTLFQGSRQVAFRRDVIVDA